MAEQKQAVNLPADNELLQIVDGDLGFSPNLSACLTKWNLINKGFDYQVAAILGCQSSGKSTLLNRLFGTTFQVMDADSGRTQTTVGIWLGKSHNPDNSAKETMVLDVEGTDSRERGEDAANYERKTSLFSLAMAEILLINLWAADIGRYNAANYSLLKVVFELNLQLFQKSRSGKTLLMFVIRDHVRTPLEKLTGCLDKDMAEIWASLTKPPEFAQSQASDFFDFAFTSLPHKELEPEKFEESVKALRARFTDPDNENYIWKQTYKTDVPADGWPQYASTIWETIRENKDLDLPTQKEMLAMVRCEDIAESVYRAFQDNIAPCSQKLSKQPVDEFGAFFGQIVEESIAKYDGPASRYHKEVSAKKRENLLGRMMRDLRELFALQLARISEIVLSSFDKQISTRIGTKQCVKHFDETIQSISEEARTTFDSKAKASLVSGASWTFEHEQKILEDEINKKVSQERERQLNLLNELIKANIRTQVIQPIGKLLDNPTSTLWTKAKEMYLNAIENNKKEYFEYLQGFGLDEAQIEEKAEEVSGLAFGLLRDKVKEKSSMLIYTMEKCFDNQFRLEPNGIPRRWKPGDDVNGVFTSARDSALELIDMYSLVRISAETESVSVLKEDPELEKVPSEYVILSHDETLRIADQFKRQVEATYHQAIRDQESAGLQRSQPLFWILLVIILGFDEFMYLLSSPMLLVLFVLMGGLGFVGYQLNLHKVALPVLAPVINVVFTQANAQLARIANPVHQKTD